MSTRNLLRIKSCRHLRLTTSPPSWSWLTTITILDIIHRPLHYLERDISETGFCLRRKRRALSIRPTWVGYTRKRRQNPVSDTSCFKDRTMNIVQKSSSYINIPSSHNYRSKLIIKKCESLVVLQNCGPSPFPPPAIGIVSPFYI
jgi:hypothetical protein